MRGAEIACELFAAQAAEFLKSARVSVSSLNEEFGRFFVLFAQKEIAALAAELKSPARELASTFLGAIVGEAGAAFYQVGDGAIVFSLSGAPESYRFGVEPSASSDDDEEKEEYVNQTDFVTDARAAERLRFNFINEPVEDLILFSDGIFPVAVQYKTLKPHEPFLMPMLAPLRRSEIEIEGLNQKLEIFFSSAKINEKTDDDKTIILASRGK
jgi:hypothetical protein